MVQNGIFYAGTFRLDRILKVLLLPMLAIPSSPIFKDVPVLPSLTRFIVPFFCVKWCLRVLPKSMITIIHNMGQGLAELLLIWIIFNFDIKHMKGNLFLDYDHLLFFLPFLAPASFSILMTSFCLCISCFCKNYSHY